MLGITILRSSISLSLVSFAMDSASIISWSLASYALLALAYASSFLSLSSRRVVSILWSIPLIWASMLLCSFFSLMRSSSTSFSVAIGWYLLTMVSRPDNSVSIGLFILFESSVLAFANGLFLWIYLPITAALVWRVRYSSCSLIVHDSIISSLVRYFSREGAVFMWSRRSWEQ